ncbi:ABC transporter substrate-binding protein [Streptomyces sp. TRM68367]|uniref:ABC transporter substrate-binding protein n=1 Tax=Streptomyces sp. TRM68367 TaxID=2758415 RepID=UPI00165CCF63|nr:ABC transporter substrate-binding protein [Streptomyces sp. TRM68367]MBC9727105.1 carbohydrate ABC transporter substrate-binding protein [Streptomyces sp. TRM68367]
MNRRTVLALAVGAALVAAGCTGTSRGTEGAEAEAPTDPSKVRGTITVLTVRTDLVQDGTMDRYAAEFRKTYPKVKVEFQALTNYESEIKIRMNTEDYGDVLLIPAVIEKDDYPKFFASLGTQAERSKKYRFTDYTTVDGKVYGQSPVGVIPGFLYNKKVWREAGVTEWPTSPAAFLDALKAIKDKTDATPFYTNFAAKWPMTQWTDVRGAVNCDTQATTKLAEGDPWAKGSELRVGDTLLHDIVKQGLAEKDPTTTNWEESKPRLARGEIATQWLGTWAIIQFQDAAKKAGVNPDDIGFMPFPAKKNGTFCAVAQPDYNQAVNVHSKHKAAARAWIDWFTDKSGYVEDNLAVSPLKDAALPAVLKPYQDAGVKIIEVDDTAGAKLKKLDNASEVGIYQPTYRQNLVDLARGAKKGSLADFFADLSKKWTDTQASLGS